MRISIEIKIRRPGWLPARVPRWTRPLVLVLTLVLAGPVLASDRFGDVPDSNVHHDNISAIADAGITRGCNAEGTLYCPDTVVTRDQMASFIARTAGLGINPPVANADLLDGLDSTALQLRVTGSCAAGEMVTAVNADGSVACEADDDTTYTGSHPIVVSGDTIGLSTARCEPGFVFKFADGGWSCAPDAIDGGNAQTLDGLDSTALQRRVTGTCAAGTMVRAVNADGTVVCAVDAIDGGNAQTLDGIDSTGFIKGTGDSGANAVAMAPGAQGGFFGPGFQLVYVCPSTLTGNGTVNFQNLTGATVNLFADNGLADPVYMTPSPGNEQFRSWIANAAGEFITLQFQGPGSPKIGTIWVFSVHRAGDCHMQAQWVTKN